MKLLKYLLSLILLVLIPTACAPPATYVVDLAYIPGLKERPPTKIEDIHIAVIPFEDDRTDKNIIGTRRRIFGQVDKFAAHPSPVTASVTQALVSALKVQGYQTEVLQRGTAVESIKDSPPQIVLSGRIEELMAEAQSKPGYTDIKAIIRLRVKFYKVEEKASNTITEQSQSEIRDPIFTPSTLQKAINEALTEAINRLIHTNL